MLKSRLYIFPTLPQTGNVIGKDPEVGEVLLVSNRIDHAGGDAEIYTKLADQPFDVAGCRSEPAAQKHGKKMIDAWNARPTFPS